MLGYTYIACLVISIHESNLFDSYFIQNIPLFFKPWRGQSSCAHRQPVQSPLYDIWVRLCYLHFEMADPVGFEIAT